MAAAGQVRLFDVATGMNEKFLPAGFAGAVTNTGTIVTERKYQYTYHQCCKHFRLCEYRTYTSGLHV